MNKIPLKLIAIFILHTFCLSQAGFAAPVMQNLRQQTTETRHTASAVGRELRIIGIYDVPDIVNRFINAGLLEPDRNLTKTIFVNGTELQVIKKALGITDSDSRPKKAVEFLVKLLADVIDNDENQISSKTPEIKYIIRQRIETYKNYLTFLERPYRRPVVKYSKPAGAAGKTAAAGKTVFELCKELDDAKKAAQPDEALIQNITKQIDGKVISAFNKFNFDPDNPSVAASSDDWTIKPPEIGGRLHRTFIVTNKKTGKKYVAQNLSPKPFDLDAVEHIFHLVEIAQDRAEEDGAFKEGGVLEGWVRWNFYDVKGGEETELYGKKLGQKILRDDGESWRVMEYIEGKIYNKLADIGEGKDEKTRREYQLAASRLYGEAMAKFFILMRYIPDEAIQEDTWQDTLPDFHNNWAYIKEVNGLFGGNWMEVRPGKDMPKARLIPGLMDGTDIEEAQYTQRAQNMQQAYDAVKEPLTGAFGALPQQLRRAVCHGDLKINNAIYEEGEEGRPVAVKSIIDPDTVGIYTAVDDLGDGGRSLVNILGESVWEGGKTVDDIVLDGEVLENIIYRYLAKVARPIFGQEEISEQIMEELEKHLYRAVAVYFFQLGTRFLKAFITEEENGRNRHFVYFNRQPGDIEDKNLRLAEVQYAALIKFLRQFRKQLKLEELGINPDALPDPIGWSEPLAQAAAGGAATAQANAAEAGNVASAKVLQLRRYSFKNIYEQSQFNNPFLKINSHVGNIIYVGMQDKTELAFALLASKISSQPTTSWPVFILVENEAVKDRLITRLPFIKPDNIIVLSNFNNITDAIRGVIIEKIEESINEINYYSSERALFLQPDIDTIKRSTGVRFNQNIIPGNLEIARLFAILGQMGLTNLDDTLPANQETWKAALALSEAV